MPAVALYGIEIWWNSQNGLREEYQKLVNRHGRVMTGMFRSAPTGIVASKVWLRPSLSLLNNRQWGYIYRLLTVPVSVTTVFWTRGIQRVHQRQD